METSRRTQETKQNNHNWASQFASSGGSSSVARRFLKKTQEIEYEAGVAWRVACDRQAISGKFQKLE